MFSWFGGDGDGASNEDKVFERFTVDTNKKYGEGGYGATYAAYDNEKKENLAVKIIDTRRMRSDAIVKECKILESLDHPNVIAVKAHSLGPKKKGQNHLYFIFMELAGGGELFDQVIDRGANAMGEDVAKGFIRQMLAGVQHCHERMIAHRDLKLENVLLTKEGVVKVIDFGLSHVYEKKPDGTADRSTPLKDMCGSKSYAAPEVMGGHGYDGFAADVWSLGVSLFAMLSGFFPLDEATPKDWRFGKLIDVQNRGRSTTASVYSWYKRSHTHLSPSVISLMDGMLQVDPAKRATMAQVLAHPWIKMDDGMADQGSYNAAAAMDDDGPAWRGAFITGEAVQDASYDMEEDGDPIYRSLGCAPNEVPVPGLGRQRPFAPWLDLASEVQ